MVAHPTNRVGGLVHPSFKWTSTLTSTFSHFVREWFLVGAFNPSEKYESVGMRTFPIYGKIKNVPNHQPVMLFVPCKKDTMILAASNILKGIVALVVVNCRFIERHRVQRHLNPCCSLQRKRKKPKKM